MSVGTFQLLVLAVAGLCVLSALPLSGRRQFLVPAAAGLALSAAMLGLTAGQFASVTVPTGLVIAGVTLMVRSRSRPAGLGLIPAAVVVVALGLLVVVPVM